MNQLKTILSKSKEHNYKAAFVLVKPSRPHYVQGDDYLIEEPFTGKILSQAKLVIKRTYELHQIPEIYAYLCRDLNLPKFKQVLRNHNTERLWDVLVFSSNAFYNDFYKENTDRANEYRQRENMNPQLSIDV